MSQARLAVILVFAAVVVVIALQLYRFDLGSGGLTGAFLRKDDDAPPTSATPISSLPPPPPPRVGDSPSTPNVPSRIDSHDTKTGRESPPPTSSSTSTSTQLIRTDDEREDWETEGTAPNLQRETSSPTPYLVDEPVFHDRNNHAPKINHDDHRPTTSGPPWGYFTPRGISRNEPLTKHRSVIWPHPRVHEHLNLEAESCLALDARKFQIVGMDERYLSRTMRERFFRNMFPRVASVNHVNGGECGFVAEAVVVEIHHLDASLPTLGVDESYNITVPGGRKPALENDESLRKRRVARGPLRKTIRISAVTRFGALHALESLSQLVAWNYDHAELKSSYQINGVPQRVVDWPRLPHRELLLDVSRHFIPIPVVLTIIDTLPYAKINVLHLHLLDRESFPYCSHALRKFCEGAFSPEERYTKEDLEEMVAYAAERGVRVVPELDVPAHAESWCVGYPEICPSSGCASPLDVSNERTFEVIEALFREIRGIFPDEVLHAGGDEVSVRCWEQDGRIMNWIREKLGEGANAKTGLAYFLKRVHAIALKVGYKQVTYWADASSHLDSFEPPSSVTFQRWMGMNDRVWGRPHRVITTPDEDTYLDHPFVDWQQVYLFDPCENLDDAKCSQVVGSGAELWTERVNTGNVISRVWPRLGAIAERTWQVRGFGVYNRQQSKIWKSVHIRMELFKCLLQRRGVATGPYGPSNPGSCFSPVFGV